MVMAPSAHQPVLLHEVVEALHASAGDCIVDCTVGPGGHAEALLEQLGPSGRLLGIDADPDAIELARRRLSRFGGSAILVNRSFVDLSAVCHEYGFHAVDGILFDLGLSSMQVDSPERGFSFQRDAPLDMRFDPSRGLTAADIINTYPEREIARILREYGEERRARRIARSIVRSRPITSTVRLARLVEQVLGSRRGRIHPATRTFMALRIAVNQELDSLSSALAQTPDLLAPGGRLVVISYHSLEDRIVKQFMRSQARDSVLQLVSRKVIRPTSLEIESNPRSRSAKLRIAERSRQPDTSPRKEV
ncbi:MAG: 16S rRNA (cytosine(1402)-N(4))-methyltransferase RsmH [Chloroflexota bacterium]